MIEVTARAIASGSLSAAAPLSAVRISARADVRDTTGGCAAGQRLEGRQPERLMRTGGQCDVGAGQDRCDGVAAADVAGEVDGKAGGLPFEPCPQRSLAYHDESGVDARIPQRGNGVDTAMCMFLHGKAPAVHQQRLLWLGPPLTHRRRVAARMKLIEVDAKRHRDHVGGVYPVELFAGERRRTDDGVVARRGPAVGRVCDRSRGSSRKDLSDKAIEPFVGDHHGRNVVPPAPAAEGTQRQPVRHLERIGCELFQQRCHRARQHRTIAAGEWNQPGRQ